MTNQTASLPATASLTRPEYEAIPALSYSGMKELARSPAHYKAWLTADRPETKALRVGKATHCAFLTPDLWATTYKAIPDCDRRTKEGKAVHEAVMASLKPGDTALAFEEYELATNVAQAAERIAAAAGISKANAWAEVPLTAKAIGAGTKLKGIPDLIAEDGWIYDLKTTEDATERAALRTVLQYGYHLQAAHYMNLALAHRDVVKGYRIIMVEKEAPFAGAVYEVAGDLLDLGRKTVDHLYSVYDKCVAEDNWPGLPSHVTRLDTLPGSKKQGDAPGMTF